MLHSISNNILRYSKMQKTWSNCLSPMFFVLFCSHRRKEQTGPFTPEICGCSLKSFSIFWSLSNGQIVNHRPVWPDVGWTVPCEVRGKIQLSSVSIKTSVFVACGLQVFSTNNTECGRLLEEIKCARCSPNAQVLFHSSDVDKMPHREPDLPRLCQDFCREFYYTCRGHIPGNCSNIDDRAVRWC